MLSKKALSRSLTIVTLVVGAGLSISCGLKLDQKAPEESPKKLNAASCLSDAATTMSSFIQGEANDSEVRGAWSCFGSAIHSFNQYVRGVQSKDYYTPAEVAQYLQRNFLGSDPQGQPSIISVDLQQHFMKLKQVFIGGRDDLVTRTEMQSIESLLTTLSNLCVRLNPYMKILSLNWVTTHGDHLSRESAEFEEANRALSEAASDLGTILQKNDISYQLDDLTVFVREMADFAGEKWSLPDTLQKYLPVAKKVKKALTGGSEEEIHGDEWNTVLVLSARGYIQYLRYHYFVAEGENTDRSTKVSFLTRTFEDTLSLMQDMVSHKPSGVLTRTELNEILASLSVAVPSFKSSDTLVTEVMRVKQVFFGGNMDYFSIVDFTKARSKTGPLNEIVQTLLPHTDIYFSEWKPENLDHQKALEAFESARADLNQAAIKFGGLLEGSYDLKNLVVLLNEWSALYPPTKADDVHYDEVVAKYLPVLMQVKAAVYGTNDSVIAQEQWRSFLSVSSRLYSVYLFEQDFVADHDWHLSETLDSISTMGDQGLGILSDVLKAKPSHILTRVEIQGIMNEISKLDLLPEGFGADTLSGIVSPLLNKVLNPPADRLAGRRPDGIQQATLDYARNEMRVWIQTQMFLNDAFVGKTKSGMTMPAKTIRDLIDAKLRVAVGPELKAGLIELGAVLNTSLPLALDSQDRLMISSRTRSSYDLNSLQQHNIIRAGVRLALAGYAGSKDRIDKRTGVTSSEAVSAFNDFKSVLISLGMISSSSSSSFMTKRFLEANLFMPRGNGDGLLSFNEAHELVYALISGNNLAKTMRTTLGKNCLGEKTLGRNSSVSYDCLVRTYQRSSSTFSSMPEFLRFQNSTNGDGYSAYIMNALKASGWTQRSSVSLSEANLLPQILQYIELLYARFDANGDGKFSVSEGKAAFPVFRDMLKTLAKAEIAEGTIKEEDLLALFIYILHYGKPPSGVWEGLTVWYPWKDNPASWTLSTDRTQMAQILGYIADQVASASVKGAPRMVPVAPAK